MKYKKNSGFTLIELLMAMMLFVILIGGIAGFTIYYFNNYAFSFEAHQNINIAKNALTTMVREVREARTSENGSWPIEKAESNEFVFYSDVTNDGMTDKVRYFLNDATIYKGVIKPDMVLLSYPPEQEIITIIATDVNNAGKPIFQYYNTNWPADQINNPLATGSSVMAARHVNIYIKANVKPDRYADAFELSTSVTIRGLKDY